MGDRTEQLIASVMRTLIFVFASVTVGIVQAAEVKSYDDIIKREVNGCDYPEECTQDIENIIVYCIDSLDPRCLGAIIYAHQHCSACLCRIVANEIDPELIMYLCPLCPKLSECNLAKAEKI